MLPTPPAAPVTSTGPASGMMPASSSVMTHSMAVRPAVPIVIALRASSPSGMGTSHSGLARAFCA